MPYDQQSDLSPFNSLPPVVIVLSLAMVAVQAVLGLADAGMLGGAQGIGLRQQIYAQYSVWAPAMLPQLQAGLYPLEVLWRFVTYPFVDAGFAQILFPVVILLATGKFVGAVYSGVSLFLTWAIPAVVAGVVFVLLPGAANSPPLAGGMPAAYGMIGALTFVLWRQALYLGERPVRAFRLIGFMMAFQVVVLTLFGGPWSMVAVELGAFATGFGLGFVLAPGAFARLLQRIRNG